MMLSCLPWQTLHNAAQRPLMVPYYHMVSDRPVPHVAQLYRFRSVRQFEDDLEFFSRRCAPVSLEEAAAMLDCRRRPRMPVLHLTFDDGYREMHDVVAPILLRKGIPATFFLNDSFLDEGGLSFHNKMSLVVERLADTVDRSVLASVAAVVSSQDHTVPEVLTRIRRLKYRDTPVVEEVALLLGLDLEEYVHRMQPYLSSSQVRALLSSGFTVGAHSHDHPHFADLTLEEQLAQTRTNVEALNARFGTTVRAFAFPHNDSGVADTFFEIAASECGLRLFFGTGGLGPHRHALAVQRIKMEGTARPAWLVLLRQYARAIRSRLATSRETSR